MAIISSKSRYLSVPAPNVLEERRGGVEGEVKEGRHSGEVKGGWMGAGHGFHHIWAGGKKPQQQPRNQERESKDFQNCK